MNLLTNNFIFGPQFLYTHSAILLRQIVCKTKQQNVMDKEATKICGIKFSENNGGL